MARERMITRTIITTKATVLGINTATGKADIHEVQFSGKLDKKAMLKKACKKFANSVFVPAMVQEVNTSERLFVLSEDIFVATVMEAGEILPARGTVPKKEADEGESAE